MGHGLAYSRVSREPNAVAQPDDVNGACDYCSCEDINIISTAPFIIFIFTAREGASHTHDRHIGVVHAGVTQIVTFGRYGSPVCP